MVEPVVDGKKITTLVEWLHVHYTQFQEFRLSELINYTGLREPPNETNFWQWREALRFMAGKYKQPEYFDQYSVFSDGLLPKEHYTHLALSSSLFIAYTPNASYGQADRQVKITVGRYLKKYAPQMSDRQIQEITDMHKMYYDPADVKFATTAEEFVRVYMNGPGSCMSHDFINGTTEAKLPVQPVSLYAFDPRIKLAYLENKGSISARCLVFEPMPGTKVYIRNYGEPLLVGKLKALGYELGNLLGAKLKRVHALDNKGNPLQNQFVCPFIDDQYGKPLKATTVSILPTHLEISNLRQDVARKLFTCTSTGHIGDQGFLVATRQISSCGYCGASLPRESMNYAEYHDYYVCSVCEENNFTADVVYDNNENQSLILSSLTATTDEGMVILDDTELADDLGYVYMERIGVFTLKGNVCKSTEGEWIYRRDAVEAYPFTDAYLKLKDYAGDVFMVDTGPGLGKHMPVDISSFNNYLVVPGVRDYVTFSRYSRNDYSGLEGTQPFSEWLVQFLRDTPVHSRNTELKRRLVSHVCTLEEVKDFVVGRIMLYAAYICSEGYGYYRNTAYLLNRSDNEPTNELNETRSEQSGR